MKGKDPDMPFAGSGEGILLRMAAYKGHLAQVKFLVEKGSNTAIKNDEDKTALDYAIEQEQHEVAAFLSSKESRRSPRYYGQQGQTLTAKERGARRRSHPCTGRHGQAGLE